MFAILILLCGVNDKALIIFEWFQDMTICLRAFKFKCSFQPILLPDMQNVPEDVLGSIVESLGLNPAMKMSKTSKSLLVLQQRVIGQKCKRLCSRQMSSCGMTKTRRPRQTPTAEAIKICDMEMMLALTCKWLQTFVEEIDCLHMSCTQITFC